MTGSNHISGKKPNLGQPIPLAVMGSTGSIGTQTLEVAAAYPRLFRVETLTANKNWELLARQARQFKPRMVAIADERYYLHLKEALADMDVQVTAGNESLVEAATFQAVEIVVGALVGYSGLESAVAALEAGKTLALANKETLVVAGEIIEEIVARKGNPIRPIDSEHSAIFQCLWGENTDNVSKIVLTASGGPFRKMESAQLENVTVKQALAHPNWVMGAKVSIDSATMMNKGFEMIEAKWLFNRQPSDIEVLVHPESIVHSMVEFADGSVKAQLGMPDMRVPIAVALAYPDRLDLFEKVGVRQLSLAQVSTLTFEKPDTEKFPLLKLAYEVAEQGGLLPALMNAANEVAVKNFLEEKIKFNDIYRIVRATIEGLEAEVSSVGVSIPAISKAHDLATAFAENLVNRH